MLRFIAFVIFLVVVVALGIELKHNPGYMLLSTNHWAVELPLWLAVVGIIVVFLVLYFLIRMIKYGGSLSGRWHNWSLRRSKNKAIKQTNKGLIQLVEGNWQQAEKLLAKSAIDSDEPLLNYLALALAAQGRKDYPKRAEYLHEAHDAEPSADIAIGIMQAQLQINHKQYEQALATLRRIHEINPKQQLILRLLKFIYVKLADWKNLVELLPKLKKYADYPDEKFLQISIVAYQHLFQQLSTVVDVEKVWHDLSSQLKLQTEIVMAYIKRLQDLHAEDKVIPAIAKLLKKHWSSELVAIYGDNIVNAKEQFSTAQKWLEEHQADASLLTTLGQLALANDLTGQAQEFLQASIAMQPLSKAYLLLGELFEKTGDKKQSRECYKQGLELVI